MFYVYSTVTRQKMNQGDKMIFIKFNCNCKHFL